jgi:NTP-dependent ternary system trypsin peptidase co-occuring protein
MELGLIELIEQLKRDIATLEFSHDHMFTIQSVELELKFVVEKSLDATGKAHWILFAAEAKGKYKDQHVNTVKLTLKPMHDLPAFK